MNHSRKRRGFSALAAISMLVFGVTACGKVSDKVSDKVGEKVAEKSIEGATGAKVDASDGELNIKTEDGEFSSKTTKDLPDDWPSDMLPIPDGFEIVNVSQTKTAEGEMKIVNLEGKGDPAKLVDDFAERLEANGAELALQNKTSDGGMIVGKKGELGYHVTTGSSDDGTTLILSTTHYVEQEN